MVYTKPYQMATEKVYQIYGDLSLWTTIMKWKNTRKNFVLMVRTISGTEISIIDNQLRILNPNSEEDYRLFCIALLQKYVPTESNQDDILVMFFKMQSASFKSSFKNLSKEEKLQLKAKAEKIHDQLMEIFKHLPSKMILVSRWRNVILNCSRLYSRYWFNLQVIFFTPETWMRSDQ